MSEQSYSRELTVSAKPEAVYKAITKEIDKWWFTNAGEISKVGQVIKFVHWTMRITELSPNQKVVMECIKANHLEEGVPRELQEQIKEEWLGTTITWTIEEIDKGLKVSVQHKGLVQALFCYDMCSKGWDYFWESLKKYLETGTGMPAEVPE